MNAKDTVITGQDALKIKKEIAGDISKSWLNECCARQAEISFKAGQESLIEAHLRSIRVAIQEGRKEVVDWIERNSGSDGNNPLEFSIFSEKEWQTQRKEWGFK